MAQLPQLPQFDPILPIETTRPNTPLDHVKIRVVFARLKGVFGAKFQFKWPNLYQTMGSDIQMDSRREIGPNMTNWQMRGTTLFGIWCSLRMITIIKSRLNFI